MLSFEVAPWVTLARSVERPLIVLHRLDWDDYGHKVTFRAWLRTAGGEDVQLGDVKILQRSGDEVCHETNLPERFCALGDAYLSRVQGERWREHLEGDFDLVRQALREVSEPAAPLTQGWPADVLLQTLFRIFQVRDVTDPHPHLRVQARLDGFAADHVLDLRFGSDLLRCGAIAGNNGTGKTQLLQVVAKRCAIPVRAEPGVHDPDSLPFRGALLISWSPFDLPRATDRDLPAEQQIYAYAGLHRPGGALDLEWALDEMVREVSGMSSERTQLLKDAWEWLGLSGRDLALAAVDASSNVDVLRAALRKAAAGHQMLVLSLIHIVARLEHRQLLLIDEPEAHLHPSLLSSWLRALHRMVKRLDAYMLIGTHSAIPLQEIPARMVRVLTRSGTVPSCMEISGECFGEDLATLHETAFTMDPRDRNWSTNLAGVPDDQVEEFVRLNLRPNLPFPVLAWLQRRRG